jgi:NhaP-type Na+/H+ or K+/H+ antiporter
MPQVPAEMYSKMHNILLGQGLLCDMVSVLLVATTAKVATNFRTGNTVATLENNELTEVLLWVPAFLLGYSSISFIIGFAYGFIGSLMLKYQRAYTKNTHIEMFILLLIGFMSYVTGDLCRVSGVVSIITTAVMFAMYAWYNLSEQG